MPNWKKVIVSGSSPELSNITVSGFNDGAGATIVAISQSLAERIASSETGGVSSVAASKYISSSRAGGTETVFVSASLTDAISGSFRAELSGSHSKFVGGGVSGSVLAFSNKVTGSISSTGSFGRLEVAGNGSIIGNLVLGGNITIGDANTDNIAIGGEFTSNLIPDANDTYELGSVSKRWNRLHVNEITASGDISSSAASTASFGHLLVDGSNVNALTADQIAAVGGGILSASVEGDAQGQIKLNNVNVDINALGTGDSPTFSALNVSNDLSVGGNLDVNGTLTTIDSTNLRVADRFILAASGSTSGDGGLIVNTDNQGSGSAFFYDDSAKRWGLTGVDETGGSQVTATPRQYVTTVSQSNGAPSGNPSDFGTDTATRRGMMYVDTATGDIYIWS